MAYEVGQADGGQVDAKSVFLTLAATLPEAKLNAIYQDMKKIAPDDKAGERKWAKLIGAHDSHFVPLADEMLGIDPDDGRTASERIAAAINDGALNPAILLIDKKYRSMVLNNQHRKRALKGAGKDNLDGLVDSGIADTVLTGTQLVSPLLSYGNTIGGVVTAGASVVGGRKKQRQVQALAQSLGMSVEDFVKMSVPSQNYLGSELAGDMGEFAVSAVGGAAGAAIGAFIPIPGSAFAGGMAGGFAGGQAVSVFRGDPPPEHTAVQGALGMLAVAQQQTRAENMALDEDVDMNSIDAPKTPPNGKNGGKKSKRAAA